MVNKVTGILVIVIIIGITCAKLNNDLLEKKKANTFIKSRQRRSLRGGLYEECCLEDCSFEERAEFAETNGWSAVGSTLCQLSIIEDRNCQCQPRAGGGNIRCVLYDPFCRSKVCKCGGTKKTGWRFDRVTYDIPNGKVNQRALEASINIIDNINGGNLAPSISYTASKQVTETESFSQTSGTSLTVGASFSVGVPLVYSGTISTSISTSSSRTIGKSNSVARTISHTFNCPAKQGLYVICKAIILESTITIPYTMMLKFKHYGCECPSHGIYKKVQYSTLSLNVTAYTTRPLSYKKVV